MGKEYELRHSSALARVTVHVPAASQRFAILAFFVALHGIALQFCIQTSGEAHQVALEKIRKKNREDFLNGTKEEDKMPYELPSEWAPNPWASASLFGTLSLHAFFFLLCRWKVGFRAMVHFQPARQVRDGYYVQVVPLPHRGQPAMVPLTYCETTCRLVFIFQRQHYEYFEPGDAGTDADADVGEVQLLQCPIEEPLVKYLKASGLSSDDAEHLKDRFGENLLEVELPTFIQCYKEQLLSPLVIFQIFVALVYAADDFVNYTLMQLLVILTMESTSVFQRLKTMKMLNSMGTKSYGIMVYRGRQWVEKSTSDLVPGDLIELVMVKSGQEVTPDQKVAPDIVPCDCVLIRGEAVASEASLTGESAPQMKDALSSEDRPLELQGRDRVHCLFSGTRIVRATEGTNKEEVETQRPTSEVPPTPNQGCLAYVVRTGFASSQGQLLQMIEFSQDKVSGDTREVIVAIVILLCCALLAAGYVLKVGLEKGDKTPHELLVKCVLILTAVVPKQLPIQTAMAVNTALMALSRAGVFCTEPYRVPLAGKLTHCLFDKTGTLTTDTLVPVGVVNRSSEPGADGHLPKVQVSDAETAAALVLAACHSLVLIDGKLTGDPIEVAALQGIGWSFDSQAETASPQTTQDSPAKKRGIKSVRILQRFHFASHLQRMAVVAEVSTEADAVLNLEGEGNYVLVKGSPEAVKTLLAKDAAPEWYDKSHTDLAERGLRVLSLAYRRLPTATHEKMTREEAEKELIFAGFIAFECLVRKDSALVVGALNESGHKVIMVTGDSPLTALHIARTCGIADGQLPGLLLSKVDDGAEWEVVTGDRAGERLQTTGALSWSKLAKDYALMTTGDVLDAAVAHDQSLWTVVDEIRVFARMTPQGKAKIIEELQKQQRHVLMCGDGGNDVGALKQADAGLALLAGYGNVNTADSNDITSNEQPAEEEKKAEEALNMRDAELAKKNRKAAKARKDFLWQKQRELQDHQRQWLEEEIEIRAKRGETGLMAQAGAMKSSMGRYTEELKKQMKEYDKTHGNVYDDDKDKDPSKSTPKDPAAVLEGLDQGGLPMVRPGDASIAAPFTTKAPSVKNCVDLIRQGRCTLLSALQQQQIMMLNCIINAYVLSALSLEGSRSSERQMMTSSWLLTTASLAFTYASPCDRMHPVRPLRSLFHPAVFISMLGQAAIHLFCMVASVRMARAAMEPDSPERQAGWQGPSLQDVSDFWKRERLRRRGLIEQEEEMDWTQYAFSMWTQPFLPNLMNTVVFLVETAQTVAILFVNYKGQPWMKGVMENRALFLSVLTVAGSVAAAAWEFQPQLNELIHLSPFPNDEFRWKVMGLVGLTLMGTFIWDRFCVLIFAPEIFKAMVDSAKKTTFRNDVVPVFVTVGKVLGVFVILGTGNLLMAGLAYWMYRRHSQDPDE
ncbi:Endoplasmic reticulum transmembrane helix translocase (Complexed with DOR1 protein 1) (Endoplasmic reticulum P5A-ATPase) (Sensitivity to the P.farinosa killer toxin protein 1) [Durusdinium trenchii]|uniref:Endoplasmic reticulum transmembrane helix translocase (Complexed with DOR1 protein 1) (Endoplasmic reticulum P5A-ATPase) (Sensitivity to the P.farinosa killer toxin protein 1) n=1 Tax=Durusdinium trenchii TaxID=1381693 RepID=A0ABP0M9D5_9DINO